MIGCETTRRNPTTGESYVGSRSSVQMPVCVAHLVWCLWNTARMATGQFAVCQSADIDSLVRADQPTQVMTSIQSLTLPSTDYNFKRLFLCGNR